ncbi:alpha/beta fold hydrolase [Imbroritus primus]|uniref:alpha/beta fold hydrolase n=1 Tax=Imbroritus primus TaxID=3058603 RepID=UPI003D160DAB
MHAATKTAGTCAVPDFRLADGTAVPLRLAYTCHGPAAGRTFLLLHGYTGSHFALDATPRAADSGWAAAWAGDGKALDTRHDRIITVNLPGSSYGSEWSGGEASYATVKAMAGAIDALLAQLGVAHLSGVIGYSFGGYVALQLKSDYPARVGHVLALCTATQGRGDAADVDAMRRLDSVDKRYAFRVATLMKAGLAEWADDHGDAALQDQLAAVRRWAGEYSAASLWRLRAAAVTFAVAGCPPDTTMLYASSDTLFPPPAGTPSDRIVETRYGHQALVLDPAPWIAPVARWVERCPHTDINTTEVENT